MAEGTLIDRLDRTVDAIIRRGDASYALSDQELAPLARVAADLRHCPAPQFKARVRAALERKATMAIISTDVREGTATITPYLRVREPGLVDFLGRVFGARETRSSHEAGGYVEREVRIGDSTLMIGEGGAQGVAPFRPAEFHVYVEDVDAAFERALAAGATSIGEPADRPYGERAGFVRDGFGNHWFIARYLGASYVPEGLRTLTPFVHTRNTSQYVEFLKHAFGAVEERRQEIGGGVIRYVRLRIGNAAIELGEAEGGIEAMPGTFYLQVGNADALHEQAIAAGATPLPAAVSKTYRDRVAGIEDAAGNQWFIARTS